MPLETFFEHQATPVDEEILKAADRIIAMDGHVFDILHRTFPKYKDKMEEFSTLIGSAGEATDVAESNEAEQHRQTNTFVIKGVRDVLVETLLTN